MSTDGSVMSSSLSSLSAPTGGGGPSRRGSVDVRPAPASAIVSQRPQEIKASEVDQSLEERLMAMVTNAVQKQFAGATRDLQEFKALSASTSSSSVGTPASGLRSALRARFSGTSSRPCPPSGVSSLSSSSSSTLSSATAGFEDSDHPDDELVDQIASNTTHASNTTQMDSVEERMAPTVFRNAQSAGSVLNWVNSQEWKTARNRRECLALAAALDTLVAEGVDTNSDGIEILVRRLSGVQLADKYDNWDLCQAVEWPYASQSLLDQHLLARAIKDAGAIARLRDRSKGKASSSSSSFGRRSFYPTNKFNNNPKKKSGVGPTAGAVSK